MNKNEFFDVDEIDDDFEEEELDDMDAMMDETDSPDAVISMFTASGEQIDFAVIAYIPLDEKTYYIMQPLMLLQGMGEDEALVFECVQISDSEAHYTIITDENVIDAVFAAYDKLCNEMDD